MSAAAQNTIKKICFVGQVDSGKSTTAGALLARCGAFSAHDLAKLSGSKKFSNLLDIFKEEQERGKTHEFCIIPFDYNGTKYELIDTPGHQILIRSMIEGISHYDPSEIIACVVISAAKGEFEAGWIRGQTKEDILLVRGVGIRNIIVLINKMDRAEWDKEVYENITKKVRSFLKNCSFLTVQFVAISGFCEMGLVDTGGIPEWYTCGSGDRVGGSAGGNPGGTHLMGAIESLSLKIAKKSGIQFPDHWNKMVVDIRAIKLSLSVITAGYECVLHYESGEYLVVVDRIINKTLLRENDSGKLIISSSKPFTTKRSSANIIFRNFDHTVGFGRILKVLA
jgi:translation elongation factor EF-1alpha